MLPAEVGEWIPLSSVRGRLPRVSGIYIVRNTVSGKEYVGLSQDIRRRVSRHQWAGTTNSLLHRAVKKHGVGVFEVCVHTLAPFSELPALELLLVEERRTMRPNGYNLTAGGEGTTGRRHSDETKKLLRDGKLGKPLSEEHKAKISAAAEWLWTPEMRARTSAAGIGKTRSDETKKRMGEANRRRPPEMIAAFVASRVLVMSDATKAKLSVAASSRTPEHRAKLIAAHTGTKASHETKALMRAAKIKSVWVWPPGSMVPLEFSSVTAAAAWAGKTAAFASLYCSEKLRPKDGSVFAYVPK